MINNDLLYQIALTKVPNIGPIHAKALVHSMQNASAVFNASARHLEKIEGIGTVRARAIRGFKDFDVCEKEIQFLQKHKIQPLFFTDSAYPKRLANCYDAPVLLYYKGVVDLNTSKFVAIVGTRNHSDYGKWVCEKLIADFAPHNVVIVSGLAYGIDTIAHRNAVQQNIPTIAALAHGLDRIYPSSNTSLAKQMIQNGGLLTSFPNGTAPDKQNFPSRNRITAGISDAIIVVESASNGGALITAELGNSYHKDVFAIPGKVNDAKSEGCNALIKNNKACLISSAQDVIDHMGWDVNPQKAIKKQMRLFPDLSFEEQQITAVLKTNEVIGIDHLLFETKLSFSEISSALLSLEMNGLIQCLPGKMYQLLS